MCVCVCSDTTPLCLGLSSAGHSATLLLHVQEVVTHVLQVVLQVST